jgi:hypothetical protein
LSVIFDEQNQVVEQASDVEQSHPQIVMHTINYDDPEVLYSADTAQKLAYKELLHILERDPELNKQIGKQSNYETKNLLIKGYPQFRGM